MSIIFDLGLYHFKSYKNGQFQPSPLFEEVGDMAITFEYDGTNDIYVIPKFIVDTLTPEEAVSVADVDYKDLDDLVASLKYDYKLCLDSGGGFGDVDLNKIIVKDIMF